MIRTSKPLSGTDLLVAIRDILVLNPERHDQALWLGNVFTPGFARAMPIPVEQAREFANTPVPTRYDSLIVPRCGTTACVAGWAAILSAAEGMEISVDGVYHNGEYVATVFACAREAMGLSFDQADWMFDGRCPRDELIAALDELIKDAEAARSD